MDLYTSSISNGSCCHPLSVRALGGVIGCALVVIGGLSLLANYHVLSPSYAILDTGSLYWSSIAIGCSLSALTIFFSCARPRNKATTTTVATPPPPPTRTHAPSQPLKTPQPDAATATIAAVLPTPVPTPQPKPTPSAPPLQAQSDIQPSRYAAHELPQAVTTLVTSNPSQIPLFSMKQVPDRIFGAGTAGQVYQSSLLGRDIVIKIYRPSSVPQDTHRFYPKRLEQFYIDQVGQFIDPQPDQAMEASFVKAQKMASGSLQLPKSDYHAECFGMVYIEELNLWGVAYEKIEGSHAPVDFNSYHQLLTHWIKVAHGLKWLFEKGFLYSDLCFSNIMIRAENGTPAFIDDLGEFANAAQSPGRVYVARSSFGSKLSILNVTCPHALQTLIDDCDNRQISMEQLGWDQIIARLEAILKNLDSPAAT